MRTPRRDGERLVLPSWPEMLKALEHNRLWAQQSQIHIQNKSLKDYRNQARSRLVELARDYTQALGLETDELLLQSPLIFTGHQCQWFHGGILIKYLIASELARTGSTSAINLIVDSDLPKNLSLALPLRTDKGWEKHWLSWPGIDSAVPMEFQPLPPREPIEAWLAGLDRCAWPDFLTGPVRRLGQSMRKAYARSQSLVEFYTLVQHDLAGSLGLHWYELPLSRLGETEFFLGFVVDMIRQSQRCREVYNGALRAYRQDHAIKNSSQPLPDLIESESFDELPFWIFRPGQSRRPLFIKEDKNHYKLSDGKSELGSLDFSATSSVPDKIEMLQELLSEQGMAIRPRAVTLTMFVRLFLADYFIHGIGGARYDEITDAFIEAFYGETAPAFACASATLRLPFTDGESFAAVQDRLRQNQRDRRDLIYNPQRFVATQPSDDVPAWLLERQKLIARSVQLRKDRATTEQRAQVFRELRRINKGLTEQNNETARRMEQQYEALQKQLADAEVMNDREYFFGLFEPEHLEQLRADFS